MSSLTRTLKLVALGAAAGAALFAGFQARAATLQVAPDSGQHQAGTSTPSNWNYEIRNGQRVPKASNRVVAPDGSWREEIRQGSCVTVKEHSAAGEYKETRSCD